MTQPRAKTRPKTDRATPKAEARLGRPPAAASAKKTALLGPGVERAPPRGKYDRSHTAEERRRAQRARLYVSATRVFAERGYAGSTVDDVCVDAGVSRRTFYEHFEDLPDLLAKLHERLGKRAFAAVEQYVSGYEHAQDRTRAGVEGLLGLIANFPAESKVVFRELRAAGPAFEHRRAALLARFTDLLLAGVADAYAKGIFSVAPDETRAFACVAAIEAVGMRYVDRGQPERAVDAGPALIDMLMRTFT